MDADVLKGLWKQLRGGIKERWGELTDDDVAQVEGNRDKLVGKLQEKYGYTKEEAQREVHEFLNEVRAHRV
ncbi:MAG TPA: CsbD family protein [Chloroflexi bacterium]|nr:CsbD family protein [Chloroflexota bacterium]